MLNLDYGKTDSFILAKSAKSRNMKTISTSKDKMILDLNVYDSNSYAPIASFKQNNGNRIESLENMRHFKIRGYASNLGRTKTLPEINQVDVRISKSRLERQSDVSFT